MKQTHHSVQCSAATAIVQQTNQKGIYFSVLMALLMLIPFFSNAQFVKTYQTTPQQSLTFNCISKSLTGTYFIAGIVDTSVYVAEVDPLGNLIREKLIGVGNNAYNLTSMITDANGCIVIVGSIKLAATNTQSFLMKISPALGLLLHKKYENLTQKGSVITFNDIKEDSPTGDYYISGATRNYSQNTAADVLLVTVDRNSGTVTNQFSGSSGEDGYDAFVLAPQATGLPGIYATGRLSHTGTITFRPWINIHDQASLSFTGTGRQYLKSLSDRARLYSSSLLLDAQAKSSLVYCWQGDLSPNLDFGINIGMGSFNTSDLSPNWQTEYVVSPTSAKKILLNKVAADANGYVAEGNWWDGVKTTTDGAIAGEMFFIRTDKGGRASIWSRKLSNVYINQRSHNAGMLIDGSFIYAVGFRPNRAGVNSGVLVKMPLTGAMDTTCAPVQTVTVNMYDYSVPDVISKLDIVTKDSLNYYPVNCVQTQNYKTCDTCYDIKLPSPCFELAGQTSGTNYIVTASSFAPTPDSRWIVSEVDQNTNLDFSASIYQSTVGGSWGTNSTTNFGGYNGVSPYTGSTENSGIGTFAQNHKYRFKHIVSATNNCGITQSDTCVKTIFICSSCRNSNSGFIITAEKEKDATTGKQSAGDKAINPAAFKTIAYPNPADNSITFNLANLQANNPVLQVMDAKGQPVKTIKVSNASFSIATGAWASGSYLYQVIAGGKIINKGSFIVQH